MAKRTKAELPLYTGGYKSDSSWISSFRCVNLYPEFIAGEVGASASTSEGQQNSGKITLVGTPGTVIIDSVGPGPHRGSIVHLGEAYFVSNKNVYKMDSLGTTTLIGQLTTSSGTVSMSSNGQLGGHLSIVDGIKLWVWDGATFTDYTASLAYPNPIKTLFSEGYTFIEFEDSPTFQISNFYDSTTWSALDIATAELSPGNLLSIAKYNRQVWLLGEQVTEIWYHSGNDFPFDPVPNGLIEWGILAPDSVVSTKNNGLLWLAKNEIGQAQVVQTKGFAAENITPPTILSIWRKYPRLDDAIAYVYQEHGHIFYVLTFPTANRTWVYDVIFGGWHERATLGGKHRGASYVYFMDKHILGDFESGNIYHLDLDTFTDNDAPILRTLTTAHLSSKRELTKHNFLELEGEAGTGNLQAPGNEPKVTLEYSDDGGHTYSNARTTSYGVDASDYNTVARWPFLGMSRNRVYQLTMSDPIKWRLSRLILDYSEQDH
jgi:hypothetical protein